MNPSRIAVSILALSLGATACGSAKLASTSSGTAEQAVARLGPSYDTVTGASATLNGAGANSIQPFFQRVFYDYGQKNSKTKVNYSPAGSSVGITDIEQNTVDFGDSEIPMSAADQAKANGGSILQIPVDLGGVAISYNIPGAPADLRLDGPTLAAIFEGTITKWNDPTSNR